MRTAVCQKVKGHGDEAPLLREVLIRLGYEKASACALDMSSQLSKTAFAWLCHFGNYTMINEDHLEFCNRLSRHNV